jgi:hypothetical protein
MVTGGSFGFAAAGAVVVGDCGVVVEGGDVAEGDALEGADVAGAGAEFGVGVPCAPAAPHAESQDATRKVEPSHCERRAPSGRFLAETLYIS